LGGDSPSRQNRDAEIRLHHFQDRFRQLDPTDSRRLAVSRYAAPLLCEVSPRDPSVIGRAAALLLAAAATACIVPVRRAVRSDAVECLRSE
jgi:hypothetical protein